MDRENLPPALFLTDNDSFISDTDIMRSYAIDTKLDSEYYIGDTEEIETTEALLAPDSEQFIITAIKKEVNSLISETMTLQPITRKQGGGYVENTDNKRTWKIRTTLKFKRKKKPNREPDKHKARAAARGNTLRRAMTKANVPLPTSYSPTIMPLTFALFLQLAVIQQLHMATIINIKSAYLNTPLSPEANWIIITTLEPHISSVCGLDPAQEYIIANALYGLPDSGRLFYLHFKTAFLAEGYTMSAFDNAYSIALQRPTYIIVYYVDDTFIFSNSSPVNVDNVITNVGKHYEVTLDRDATSLTLLITPTALSQLPHPSSSPNSSHSTRHERTPCTSHLTHIPLSQRNRTHNPNSPTIPPSYLRLLGILLYLTKSLPDIMAAVSFAGMKSSNPTNRDMMSDLYYVRTHPS